MEARKEMLAQKRKKLLEDHKKAREKLLEDRKKAREKLLEDRKKSLQIQRLPDFALIEVLKNMVPLEVVALSMTSRKSTRLIRSHYKLPLQLQVYDSTITNHVSFAFYEEEKRKRISSVSVYPKFLKREYWITKDTMDYDPTDRRSARISVNKVWRNILDCYTGFVDHLIGIFNINDTVYFNSDSDDPVNSFKLLQYIQNCGFQFHKLDWNFEKKSDEEVNRALLTTINSPKLQDLTLKCVTWLTVEMIGAFLHCPTVVLTHTKFTNENFNAFLKHWIANEGNVKSWDFYNDYSCYGSKCYDAVDINIVMDGLNGQQIRSDIWRVQKPGGALYEVESGRHQLSLRIVDQRARRR